MNKRILFYYKLFFSGGTEHSILKLIKKLYQDFDIIVAYDEEESTDDVLKEIAKYAEVVNLNKIDFITVDKCIICYHPRQEAFAKFGKKVRAEHYYFWGHILLFETYPDLTFPEDLIEKIEKYICVSESVKRDIILKYPTLENKCEVIDNYLDVKEIIEKSNESIQFKIDKKKLNIVTVARIAKDKGFKRMKWLCDAFEKKNILYDWFVLGTAFKKETSEEIQSWFKGNEHIHFLGYRENVFPYIKNMDYLVLLTDREACCLVISEALILGVPCIVSDFYGVEKQIKDQINGIILDMNNINESYENRINDIISLKEVLKENVEKQDYDREKIIEYWKKLLES